jgi:hypothetical protein
MRADELRRLRELHRPQMFQAARHELEGDNNTYHGGYTLPGGDNYREMLIKAPKQPDYMKQIETAHNELRNMPYHGRTPEQEKRVGQLAKLIREIEAKTKELPEQFQGVGVHFGGEPGILASLRLKDRTGPNGEKLLHLEELQSDWHQQGREKGYKDPQAEQKIAQMGELKRTYDELNKRRYAIHEQASKDIDLETFDKLMDEANGITPKLLALNSQMHDLEHLKRTGVPDAPFKKNWEEMALKRLIHHAAENGYHGVVVTPGAEQANRYSLANVIDEINVIGRTHAGTGKKTRTVALDTFDGKSLKLGVDNDGVVDYVSDSSIQNFMGKNLSEVVGKDVAKNIMSGESQTISGAGLTIGGEGMKGFYDKKVPNILNSIGKKYGVKTELHAHPIETGRNEMVPGFAGFGPMKSDKPEYAQAHYFPITEEMRQDVKQNGIPLYESGGSVSTH